MILHGDPVLTADEMRAAEQRVIDARSSVTELMERAGGAVATWVHRLAAGREVLIACGPGNNGGDGYVAARALAANGVPVRVAALGEPQGAAAAAARAAWTGPVESFLNLVPPVAPIFVDALFGTGLTRPLDPDLAHRFGVAIHAADLSIAVDMPSFLASDTGVDLGIREAVFDVTLALGALKPAHVLEPSASRCGTVRTLDIGVPVASDVRRIADVMIDTPTTRSHKYNRGMVAVVGGPMHGASELAALAAYRAGAGYVLLLTGGLPQQPHAIVRSRWSAAALSDPRIGAVVVGPGLGRDDRARDKLAAALASPLPLVIDGDALHLVDLATLVQRAAPTILTPHAGEFAALFNDTGADKIARAQHAARKSKAVVVFKGADTVVAHPVGRAAVLPIASPLLSVAGTGDVLAGAIAALLARHPDAPFEAASAGAWLHARAARQLDRCFLADELAAALPAALAQAHG